MHAMLLMLVLSHATLAEDNHFQALSVRLEGRFAADDGCAANARRLKDADSNTLRGARLTVFERLEVLEKAGVCMELFRSSHIESELRKGRDSMESLNFVDASQAGDRAELVRETAKARADVAFLGYNWGAGFGFSHSFDAAIEDAEIVNGIVRVKDDRTQQPRIVLEFHRYFLCNDHQRRGDRGCGPFIAVAADENDLLSGVGAGFMFGWRTPKDKDGSGFSVGLGGILDANVKSLGDGFEENEPPPAGETSVRFEEKARWSALLFFTRTF